MQKDQLEAFRQRIAGAFSAAAAYDEHARVQRQAAGRLADRIVALPLPERPRICEVGCGTGFLGEAVAGRLPGAHWLATDISPEMVERARSRLDDGQGLFSFATADAEKPVAIRRAAPFDLICSNFAAQWFSDLPAVLARLLELLSPGGHLVLTTLASGTFAEWREAHTAAGLSPGTPAYPTLTELRRMRPGGVKVEVTHETYVESFPSPQRFLAALRAIGAHTPSAEHAPLKPSEMKRVLNHFREGGCQVTYVVATCALQRI